MIKVINLGSQTAVHFVTQTSLSSSRCLSQLHSMSNIFKYVRKHSLVVSFHFVKLMLLAFQNFCALT
jgi:hypothetical protein